MPNKVLDTLQDDILALLAGLTVNDGARYIEQILASWLDLLVDRKSDTVSDQVLQFVITKGVPNVWIHLPLSETCWRVIYLEFHNRLFRLRIDKGELVQMRRRESIILSDVDRIERSRVVARQLVSLPIPNVLDWLEALVSWWAITYDKTALGYEIAGQESERTDEMLLYYPIKLLVDLTEP